MVVTVKAADERAKGKDSVCVALSIRAEVEGGRPDSRSNHGPCAIGLESTRFESRTNNGEHMGLDRRIRQAKPRSEHLVKIDRCTCMKLLRQISLAMMIELENSTRYQSSVREASNMYCR